jgi:ERCC4-related helicase
LCEQQHDVLNKYIPFAQGRLLIGSDNVDRWSDQSIWDAVLNNARIVVSTHAVLADALGHGFVQMGKLALLVFDEGMH